MLSPAEAVAHAAGTRKKPGRKPRPALAPPVVTTIRNKAAHWRALHTEALARAGAGKRADASAVLRDILDEWLALRGEELSRNSCRVTIRGL